MNSLSLAIEYCMKNLLVAISFPVLHMTVFTLQYYSIHALEFFLPLFLSFVSNKHYKYYYMKIKLLN
jgi:hypothetical protein